MHTIISILLFLDAMMPFLLHDPTLTIGYHLALSDRLYRFAIASSKADPEESVKLAIRAQNHMTMIEENIRKLTDAKSAPYEHIETSFRMVNRSQQALASGLPIAYSPTIKQLQSFEIRTESALKKIYYENLLP